MFYFTQSAQSFSQRAQNNNLRVNFTILNMRQEELKSLSNEELQAEEKKMKSFSINNAFIIGFLIGIVVYSLIKNSFGFLMLIPLYLIYKLINDPKSKSLKMIEEELKDRKA